MKFLKKIFSIKNDGPTHRTLTLLGIRIKLHRPPADAHLFHQLPIQNNKIVLHAHHGAYHCNPKYIAEEIRRQGLPWELVWVVNDMIVDYYESYPKGSRMVMRGTRRALKELATAKVWIENERMGREVVKGLRKRKGQYYISTWHGSLGIKKTGQQRNDLSKKALMISKIDSSQIDYLISNSSYTTKFYKEIFWNYGTILEVGCPRNDIFFAENKEEIVQKVRRTLGIPKNKRIVLYAPTWRDNGRKDCFTMDDTRVLKAFERRFGGEWVMLKRLHYFMSNMESMFGAPNVIDATPYPDMQELLLTSDAVITDYSSCIYDFILTYRPGFIFGTDMGEYSMGRGLCYPLEETPFPLAENNDDLEKNIEQFDEDAYKARVEAFLQGKGSIDDGHAAERVVNLIKSIIEESNV